MEVTCKRKSLVTGKACGPDQINNRILKELAVELAPVLTDLFNTSLLHCTVPDIWKKANVSPVHKKDDKSSVDNYRPISLLSSVGKTMEKLIHKHVQNYLLQNNIITCFQSVSLLGIHQLINLLNCTTPFARPWTKAKKSVIFSVILVKPSTGSDIGV